MTTGSRDESWKLRRSQLESLRRRACSETQNLDGGERLGEGLMLTKRRQHGHDDDEEGDESVEDLDRQLQRAALLTPHAAASAATPCREANTMVDVTFSCNKVYSIL